MVYSQNIDIIRLIGLNGEARRVAGLLLFIYSIGIITLTQGTAWDILWSHYGYALTRNRTVEESRTK
jgi:hypothetical protein